MARQIKDILKGYFNTGDIPSEANFQDLIDSAVNTAETNNQTISSSLETHISGSGTFGSGIQGTGDSYQYHVAQINGEKITTCIIDLRGLSSSATTDTVIGLDGASESHLFQWNTASSGLLYKVELACAETPAGGEPDIDLKFSGSAQATFAAVTQSANVIIASNADLDAGEHRDTTNNVISGIPSHEDFIFLTNGSSGTTAEYTAGKIIAKFYGI